MQFNSHTSLNEQGCVNVMHYKDTQPIMEKSENLIDINLILYFWVCQDVLRQVLNVSCVTWTS